MAKIVLHGVEDAVPEHQLKYKHVLETTKAVFEEAFELYNEPGFHKFENWKKEAQTDTAIVHTRHSSLGKLFALRAHFPWHLEKVFEEQWAGLDQVAEWNENIVFSSTLRKLTDHVDVVHYANKDVYMVKSRDYVVGRIWRQVGNDYYLIARSVDVPELPETKDRVRATIHMGAGRFRIHPNNPNHTQVDLILSIDFGGLIPKSIINTVMGKLLIKDYEETKKRMEDLKNKEKKKLPN
uniref:START domain-containing protein n=1 Tax=Panagrolaimus sp. JU765 TaxID=591449 RepID=A0AC34RA96_9BILA